MFSRTSSSFGQLSAQVYPAPEFAFAWAGLRTHLEVMTGRFLCPVLPAAAALAVVCDPSPDLAPGLSQAGRLSRRLQRSGQLRQAAPATDRRSAANARKRVFLWEPSGLFWRYITNAIGGRACVFNPFLSLGLRPLSPPPVCRPSRSPITGRSRAMAISLRPPTRCKPKAGARLRGLCLARLLPMPRMRTWSPVPRLARWPGAPLVAFRACLPAADRLTSSRASAPAAAPAMAKQTRHIKASRGIPPAGLSHFCMRRPAHV